MDLIAASDRTGTPRGLSTSRPPSKHFSINAPMPTTKAPAASASLTSPMMVAALARKSSDAVTCIGTSATLTNPENRDEDNEQTAKRFASRFFGVDAGRVAVVGESYVARQWPAQRHRPAPPTGDGMQQLNRLLKALGDPPDVAEIKAVVEELTGKTPVLLLDDVMSELDEGRRHALAERVIGRTQTLITTTNLHYFDEAPLDIGRIVELGE